MSEFWKDAEEITKAVIGMYDRMSQDEVVISKTTKLNKLIIYKYHDPDAEIWFDTRGGKFAYGSGEAPGKFDVQMTLSADDAHRAWSNKLNAVMAITRKKIKVEGSITDLMKLTPLQKNFAEAYNRSLVEMGKQDIILK
jgi:putative sterol carrier protein